MILGISSYSLTWAVGVQGNLPPEVLSETDLLDFAKELDLSLVQIADNMPMHKMSEDQLNSLVTRAAEYKITLEAAANRMTPENLETYIRLSEKIKSGILRFVIDGEGFRPGLKEIISIIRNAEPELRKRNITLAIENHDRLFAHEYASIMDQVSTPNVGICLDCANSLGAGEGFHEVVGMLAPYAVNFHLKEVSIKRKYHMMGFDIEGKPFGEGCLPLEWMLTQLPPRCKTAILEQWTPPEDTIKSTLEKEQKWARQSISYLKKYING